MSLAATMPSLTREGGTGERRAGEEKGRWGGRVSSSGRQRRCDTNTGYLFLYDGSGSVSRGGGGNVNASVTVPAPPPDSEGEPLKTHFSWGNWRKIELKIK